VKENFPYLFWAYNFIWILLAAYLGVLMAKQRSLRREIDALKSKLAETSHADR